MYYTNVKNNTTHIQIIVYKQKQKNINRNFKKIQIEITEYI